MQSVSQGCRFLSQSDHGVSAAHPPRFPGQGYPASPGHPAFPGHPVSPDHPAFPDHPASLDCCQSPLAFPHDFLVRCRFPRLCCLRYFHCFLRPAWFRLPPALPYPKLRMHWDSFLQDFFSGSSHQPSRGRQYPEDPGPFPQPPSAPSAYPHPRCPVHPRFHLQDQTSLRPLPWNHTHHCCHTDSQNGQSSPDQISFVILMHLPGQ